MAAAAAEVNWVQSLLSELCISPSPPVLLCDNIGAIYLSSNPVFHSRMKHISIDIHFVRQQVQAGKIRVLHVPSVDQLADLLTKPLPRLRFTSLRDKLGVSDGPPSLRGRVSTTPTPATEAQQLTPSLTATSSTAAANEEPPSVYI